MVTGIGGTGVLTVSALLGTAGYLEGIASTTADMAGMAQKGGAVYSQVRLAQSNDDLLSPRIIAGGADLVLACDAVVAADKATQTLMVPTRTAVVANADIAPTSDFVRDRDLDFRSAQVERAIRKAANPNAADFIAADTVAVALMGDAIAANILLMGYAWQKGLIPLQRASIEQAIELNGVAIDFNKKAFGLGRLLAVRPDVVAKMVDDARGPAVTPPATTLDEMITRRIADLTAYQDAAYAERFRTFVARARTAGGDAFGEAVARSYYKLLAYKDEYEVGRLYSDGRFKAAFDAQFSGGKARVQLAPPLFSRTDPATGRPKKDQLRAVDLHRFRCAGQAEAPARHTVRHLRLQRRTPHRTRRHHGVRGRCGEAAGKPDHGQHGPRHRHRPAAVGCPRLRPGQGSPTRGGAEACGGAVGEMAG